MSYPDHPGGGTAGWQGYPRPIPPMNSYAITALVSSLVLAPLGIIFGHVSLNQIRRTGEAGRGLAVGGLVIGYLGTISAAVVGIVLLVSVNSITSSVTSHSSAGDYGGQPVTSTAPTPAGPAHIDLAGQSIDADTADAFSNSVYGQDCLRVRSGNQIQRLPDCSSADMYLNSGGEAVYKVTGRANSRSESPSTYCDGGSYAADANTILCLEPYTG